MRWTRSKIAAAAVVLAVILFFAVSIVSDAWFAAARLDLTQGGLYSVSQGTRDTLKAIPEPITLRYFFSERAAVKYAGIRAYGARVRDLLEEYESLAGGKLKVEVIDPEPLSEQEDLAVAQGVTGAQTPEGEKIYFGLVGTNAANGREVIQAFSDDREKYLEYDLTNLVYKLSRDKAVKIGVVSNIPFDTGVGGMMAAMQGRSQPFLIYEQMRDTFEVQFLEQDFDRIPADIDVLMIAHPKPLNAKTQYAIDQFIMRGGHALVFLDPWSEISQVSQDPSGAPLDGATQVSANSIDPLMKSWGVSIDPAHVVADGERAQRVQFAGGEATYVVWLKLEAQDINQKDMVTDGLSVLNLATVGAITATKDATTKLTPLLQTTTSTMLINANKVKGSPDPNALLREFSGSGERYVIGARIEGPVKSAFPNGPPPESTALAAGEPAKPALPAHIKEAKASNIILVADSDIFTDGFWVQVQEMQGQRIAIPIAHNAAFVLNAVENLTGSNALISLRSRGTSSRPFTVVEDIRLSAEKQFLREQRLLEEKMTATQNRIAELEGRRSPQEKPGATRPNELLSPEQQAEIEKFRGELVETRAALRDVQRKLRGRIDLLGNWLAAINILLVPLVIAGTAIVLAVLRRRKARAKLTGASS